MLLLEFFWWAALGRIALVLLKYFLFAGVAYLIFYVWKRRDWALLKIQSKMPQLKHIYHEIFWSVTARLMIGAIVVPFLYLSESNQIYQQVSLYGWGYFVFTVFLLIFLHDTYFYWAHRLMHHRRLYRLFHKTHHHSTNPSPWASFSFHPSETIVEVAFFPIMAFILPLHYMALLIAIMFQMIVNVYGHSGYELFPRYWISHPILKYINTSTHHNYHHKEFHHNYGLYFNHWDRWCNTLDPEYDTKFLAIKDRKIAGKEVLTATNIERA